MDKQAWLSSFLIDDLAIAGYVLRRFHVGTFILVRSSPGKPAATLATGLTGQQVPPTSSSEAVLCQEMEANREGLSGLSPA